jgi:PAS domain S-box-containing protein
MIMPAEYHSAFARSMEAYNASGKSLPWDAIMQYDGQRKDGTRFPIEISLSGWKEKNRSFFTAIVRDITERKRAEGIVCKSEGWLANTFNSIPSPAVISTIEEGRIVEVNDRFCQLTGYTREELVGRTAAEPGIITSSWRASVMKDYREQGHIEDVEIDFRRKSGEKVLGLLASNFISVEGESCILAIVTDISEIRREERERAEAEELYCHFTGDARDALTIIEGDRVRFASPETLEILGVEENELAHDTHIQLAAPEEKERLQMVDGGHNGHGSSEPIEYWIVRKDGTRRRIRNHHLIIKKDDKTVRKYVIIRDITDEKPEA